MPQIFFISGTEIVFIWHTVDRRFKTVFRAPAMAEWPERTTGTVRVGVTEFLLTEADILFSVDQIPEIRMVYVSQPVLRIDKVIAGIDIPVRFHHRVRPAGRRGDTGALSPGPLGQRLFKIHHKHLPHVVQPPVVENPVQKPAIGLCGHRPGRDLALSGEIR